MHYTAAFWIGFHLLLLVLLSVDLGVFQKKMTVITTQKALWLSGYWIALALLFNGFIYWIGGKEAALQFLTGFILEKSLSVDNLFVFLILFSYFKVPPMYQHRVLFWGVLGAIILRMTLILLGVYLVTEFDWIIYLLGIFLCISGVKFAMQKESDLLPDQSGVVKWCQKHLPYVSEIRGPYFFVKDANQWKVTPLFIVLILIESTDLIFALDSVPAIFAITTDPFIVYTSNIFAILGLRSLYFALASSLSRLKYFKLGLAALLIFVGFKMLISFFFAIPLMVSLAMIVLILLVTIIASLHD